MEMMNVNYTGLFFQDNPVHKPMNESGYFNWLVINKKTNIHAIDTKKEYLTEVYGFVFGNRISPEAIKTMKAIESFCFDFYVLKKQDNGWVGS